MDTRYEIRALRSRFICTGCSVHELRRCDMFNGIGSANWDWLHVYSSKAVDHNFQNARMPLYGSVTFTFG
jgi:hypothetical protein